MQFACASCDRTYDISPRAFGPAHDTRARCPNCKIWLIITRSANEATTTCIDPAVAAAQLSHVRSSSSRIEAAGQAPPGVGPEIASGPAAGVTEQLADPAQPPTAARRPDKASRSNKAPTAPGATVIGPTSGTSQPRPVPTFTQAAAAPSQAAAAQQPSGSVPVAQQSTGSIAAASSPTNRPLFALSPSAPSAAHLNLPPRVRHESGAERLEKGMDMFALPVPVHRATLEKQKRIQVNQMIQDFSVMFRLETTKSNRKQQVAMALALVLIAGGLFWAATEKMAYDAQLDAAKEAKKLTSYWILQSAEAEDVSVLPDAKDPAAKPRTVHTSALARQLFTRTHVAKPVGK